MPKATLKKVHPVLPCKQVKTTIDFYVSCLGFSLGFLDNQDAPTYAGVRRDDVEIHLQWHNAGDWERVERPMLRLFVTDLEELFAEFAEKNVFHAATKMRKTPWGTEEFAFYDPNGNGLTFYCDVGAT